MPECGAPDATPHSLTPMQCADVGVDRAVLGCRCQGHGAQCHGTLAEEPRIPVPTAHRAPSGAQALVMRGPGRLEPGVGGYSASCLREGLGREGEGGG